MSVLNWQGFTAGFSTCDSKCNISVFRDFQNVGTVLLAVFNEVFDFKVLI